VSIFVGNLPFDAQKEDVIKLFAPFGQVVNCRILLERDTGLSRGMAFIEMADGDTEDRAIEGLQGDCLDGRLLRIRKAQPRPGGPTGE
jgi:RNA recognition motif-containing protein